jgi:hypothetical protein
MKRLVTLLAAAVLMTLAACKKDLQTDQTAPPTAQQAPDNGFFKKDRPTPDMVRPGASQPATHYALKGEKEFTDELPTILGAQLPNPYTTTNMAAAYNLVYGTNYATLPTTDLYVRFEPVTDEQVALLDEEMELDLSDHPIDYELLQEGDYYVHPGKTVEDLPWLYTTVKSDFQFPAGIPYTLLAQLHLPGDNNLFIEELAESMAAGATYIRSTQNGQALLTRTDVPEQPSTGIPYCDFEDLDGNYIPCPPTGGSGNNPPVCGLPALRCADSKQPKGRLRVWDTQKEQCVPLAGVQVFSKRWFKGIRRPVYTDAQGNFTAAQRFSGIVKIMVQFRNNTVSVRPMRLNIGVRFSLLPLRSRLGSFSGCLMNTVDQIYYRPADRSSLGFLYWLGAHAVNARAYQWERAAFDEVKPFSGHRLVLYLVRGGEYYDRAANVDVALQSYLFKNKPAGDWIMDGIKLAYYVAGKKYVQATVQLASMVLGGQRPDLLYNYNTDYANLSSSEVNQRFYNAYAQCGLLKAVDETGSDKWKSYYKARAKLVDMAIGYAGALLQGIYNDVMGKKKDTTNFVTTAFAIQSILQYFSAVLTQPDLQFYNQVQGFGEYYGHFVADKNYGTLADGIKNQKGETVLSLGTESSHKRYLEDWDPGEPLDEDIFMKVGLFHDLEDNTPGEKVPRTIIDDFVSGIKPKDFEKAFTGKAPSVVTAPELWQHTRDNLVVKFPLQQTDLVQLFVAYNVN